MRSVSEVEIMQLHSRLSRGRVRSPVIERVFENIYELLSERRELQAQLARAEAARKSCRCNLPAIERLVEAARAIVKDALARPGVDSHAEVALAAALRAFDAT